MSKLLAFCLALTLLIPAHARALSCGDTVTSDVTLTSDLHCTTGWAALRVAAPGVTIRLNGHTLSGDAGLTGIHIFDVGKVTVTGPGIISGFGVGIYGMRSHELKVLGVDFVDIPKGASISHSLKNMFVGNTFTRTSSIALAFYDNSTVDPRLGLNHHNIAENVFTNVQGGIQLCGVETGGSTIARNWFSRANEFAIQLRESSNYNAIEENVIADSTSNGIVVRASAMNKIRQNLIDNGEIGVLVRSGAGTCNIASGMRFWAYSNEIEDNVIRGHIVGMQFGYGGPDVMTVKNYAGYNRLHGNSVGMHFKTDAVSNGGYTNDFAGTSLPFIDENGHNFH